jgi:hypothetical protein
MTTITLKNDFHHTSVELRVEVLDFVFDFGVPFISKSQALRAKRKLCGTPECICDCGAYGQRGRQLHNGHPLLLPTWPGVFSK